MHSKSLITFLMLFAFAQAALGAEAKVDKETVLSKIGGDKGFKMTFEQQSHYPFLKVPKTASGSLLFSPQRKFIWEIKGEQGGKVISNGKKTWIYTPAEEAEDKPTLIIKTGNYNGIESVVFDSKYEVSSLKDTPSGITELNVKGSKDKGYEWAVLRFREEPAFAIDSFEFKDLNGARTVIKVKTFTRLSKPVPAGTFNFKAPKGTRIIN